MKLTRIIFASVKSQGTFVLLSGASWCCDGKHHEVQTFTQYKEREQEIKAEEIYRNSMKAAVFQGKEQAFKDILTMFKAVEYDRNQLLYDLWFSSTDNETTEILFCAWNDL